ncbi:hypothetical protein, partial [Enterobacter cloacae complex sp. 2DZ2F20B]|uniref:hypothetical protein n=1 Tax=Enterobacter cloacae complex sp. 2DZ2F20B TaxID=2511993 RepID=UPI001025A843
PDLHNSDHFLISIQYESVTCQNYKVRPRWKISSADWELYADSIVSKIPATEQQVLPEARIEKLLSITVAMGKTFW